jgi:hypothetical protein
VVELLVLVAVAAVQLLVEAVVGKLLVHPAVLE